MAKHLFTSESVTEGHPDKVCDQISDAVLDEILSQDKNAHVACEVTATTGMIHVMGEISTDCYVDIADVARKVVNNIGYNDPKCGFDGSTCAVLTSIDAQSPDIAMGVNESLELKDGESDTDNQIGAGDQGMMFGYACDETPELMPMPISLAHKLAKQLTKVRKDGTLSYLRPDGKTQVTVEYDDDKIVGIDTVVISTQHDEDVTLEQIRKDLIEYVIKPIIPAELMNDNTKIFVNPTGRFVIGGPVVTQVLQAERLLLIPTADFLVTAAVHSAVRTRQRLTAVPLTTQDILQRTLLPLSLPRSAKFSLHMQSVLQSLFQLWLTHSAHQNIQTKNWQTLLKRYLTAVRSLSSDSSSSRKQSISHLPLTVIWAEKNSVLNGKRQIRLTSF